MTSRAVRRAIAVVDAATLFLALTVLAVLMLSSLGGDPERFHADAAQGGRQFATGRPCDEIYVVGDGETLHSISDRCDDPFILERNPHVHDSDDVFPGLVIKITPSGPKYR